MILETGGDGVRFKPRLVEGVELDPHPEPELLILDGQQRLTSLFLALLSPKSVSTKTEKGEEIKRHYYLNMALCLDPEAERMDAVLSVPEDLVVRTDFGRKVELDLRDKKNEYENALFPLGLVFDPVASYGWNEGFREHFNYDRDKMRFLDHFSRAVWQGFQEYKLPVIKLLRSTGKEAVCQVFEKVNTGGVTLSVFELVTASFAAEDFRLRQDWNTREKRLYTNGRLQGIDATAFLTSLTLFANYEHHLSSAGAVGCKRKDVLKLTLEDYKHYADGIEGGFEKAARFLVRQKIFDAKSLPYTTQLIPLAAICTMLGSRFDEEPIKQKLARWYWCGVLGELYGGANETRFALDLPEVAKWIDGGPQPKTISDATFAPTRLLTLQTRNSAAYKGLMALLMAEGSRDFLSGDAIELNSYFDLAVDIHHIFPRAWCTKNDVESKYWNSVVNKTLLASRTNRMLGGRAPSIYLQHLEKNKNLQHADLDQILKSHLIDPRPVREDNFNAFFRGRASKLLDLIEKATKKEITARTSSEIIDVFGGPLVREDTFSQFERQVTPEDPSSW